MAHDSQPAKPVAMSEAAYLKQQGETAQAAMTRLKAEMSATLRDVADLPAWVKAFPWPAIGVAGVAGAGAAAGIKAAMGPAEPAPEPVNVPAAVNGHATPVSKSTTAPSKPAAPSATPSALATLTAPIIAIVAGLAKEALFSAIQKAQAGGRDEAASEHQHPATAHGRSAARSAPGNVPADAGETKRPAGAPPTRSIPPVSSVTSASL